MKVLGVSPDGKKKLEFESNLIDADFVSRLTSCTMSEDGIRKIIDGLAVSADVKESLNK